MRINAASKLTLDDVRWAINTARGEYGQDIYLQEGWTGPRGQVQFWCNSAHGKYATGRNEDTGRAATWTAYGYVIALLFTRDPDARIGHYRSRDHFVNCVYAEQNRYIVRESMNWPRHRKEGPGSDCSFLSLLNMSD